MLPSFNCFLFLALFVFILTLYIILNKISNSKKQENSIKIQSLPVNDDVIAAPQQGNETGWEENPGNSFLVGIMPPKSAKWDTILDESGDFFDEPDGKSVPAQEEKKRKKKKRAKNKAPDSHEEVGKENDGLVCLYPFTKSTSATQLKIKHQYDQLVTSHGSNGLTLDQIYKLELEQKRLQEDTFVYDWLQEQLKVSPAYKKMLEIGACIWMKAKSACLVENTDTDISFEELLAQEKKDGFWQRNGRIKPCQDEPKRLS